MIQARQNQKILLILLYFLLNREIINAQCITAHAGPDQFKCTIPATFQLFGAATTPTSGAVLSYNWTPTTGLSNPNILNPTATISVPTTYTLTTKGYDLSQNLVYNGDFSLGVTGFSSNYILHVNPNFTWQLTEGEYTIGTNPAPMHVNWVACGDHTTGSGNMMLLNGATTANVGAWWQNIAVTPNTDYVFSVWVCSVDPAFPSQIQFNINGVNLGSTNLASTTTCLWKRFFVIWNSGASSSALILLKNQNTIVQGNDFAIDDIVFAPVCTATDDITLTPSLPPSPTISGNTMACASTPNNITVNGGPFSNIAWSNGATTATINANTAANYTVTVTNAAGCTATKNINVTQENVNANAGAAVTICNGQNTNLTATSSTAGATFAWNNGINTAANSVSPTTTTSYTVTVTSPNGCTQTSSVTVNVVPPPSPTLSDVTICAGTNASLSVSGGSSYTWNTGQSSSSINVSPTNTTSYIVTVSNGTCATTASSTVNVLPTPATPNITAPTNICSGSATLTADPGFCYLWSNGATTQSTTVTQSGTYQLTVTNANGCTKTTSITIAPDNLTLSANNITICNGQTANLLASSNNATATFTWDNGVNTANNAVTPLATTNYTVTATTSNGCTKTTIVTVTIVPPPVPSVADITICAGKTANLTASGGGSYTWSNGSNGANIAVSPNTTTNYSVSVSNGFCVATATAKIEVLAQPTLTITAPTRLCSGSAMLTANGTGAFQWSNGVNAANTTITQPGSYQVTITDINGCSAISQATVLAETLPTIVGNLPLCTNGGSATISIAEAYNSYQWSTGENTPNISITQIGNYVVTVTDANGCKVSNSFTVTNYPSNPISITGNVNLCPNSTTTLSASSNNSSSFLWSNNAIQNSITVSNPGIYGVTIQDNFGCKSSTTVNVVAQPQPTVKILGKNLICAQGGNITLSTNTPFTSYLWSNNTTLAQANVTTSGTFSVTVTDVNGCKATDNLSINSITVTPQITGSASFCPGSATLLSVNEPTAVSYLWSNGQTTPTTSINTVGKIAVTVTDINGCKGSTDIDISQKNTLSPTISGKTIICESNTTTFDAGLGFTSYQWSNNETTQQITVSKTGTYAVTVNDGNCSGSTAVTLLVKTNDIKIAIIGDSLICTNTTTQLEAQSGFSSYLWSNGNITNTLPNISAGLYSLTVTDSIGCKAIISTSVKNAPNPLPIILGKDTICLGETANFSVQNFNNYLWSNGATTQQIDVQLAGIYAVTVTNSEGCLGEGAVNLVTQTIEKPTIIGDAIFCEGAIKTLSVDKNYATYDWSNGAKTKNTTISKPGFYHVKVSNKYCNANDTFYVNVIKNDLKAAIAGDSIICIGDTAHLSAIGADSLSYTWISFDKSQILTDKNFTYTNGIKNWTLTVSNKFGCTATTNVKITENPLPTPTIQGNTIIINNTPTTLDAGAGFSKYAWSNGQNTQTITITQSGTYAVTVTDTNGCKNTANIILAAAQNLPKIVGKGIICPQQNDTLRVNPDFDTYLWSNGSTTPSTIVSQAGLYFVTVTKGTWVGIDTFKVMVSMLNANLKPSNHNGFGTSCEDKKDGSVTIEGLNVAPNSVKFEWNTGDTTMHLKNLQPGTYNVKITDKNGCAIQRDVTLKAPPPLQLETLAPQLSCKGEKTTAITIQKMKNGVAPFSVSINNDSTVVNQLPYTYKNIKEGNYKIAIKDAKGCVTKTEIDIIQPIIPTVSLGNDITIYPGDNVQLVATTNLPNPLINWTNSQKLSCADCLNPFIKNYESNSYTITVENKQGCEASDNIKVTVLRSYYIPTIFNLNSNNEQNKNFSILFGKGIEKVELLRIYDRWGNLVHETSENTWNGYFRGEVAQQGVYVFVATIRYLDDVVEQVKGDITLMW